MVNLEPSPASTQKYLRVLDAKLSGVTSKVIAVEILGIKNSDPEYQHDAVKDAFDAAKRLRDGGYRFLPAWRGKLAKTLVSPFPHISE